jgi:hypothetical protein
VSEGFDCYSVELYVEGGKLTSRNKVNLIAGLEGQCRQYWKMIRKIIEQMKPVGMVSLSLLLKWNICLGLREAVREC